MPEYDNTDTGVLYPARDRKTDKHPNMTGKAEVKCLHCQAVSKLRIAAWTRTSPRVDGKFLSLKFSEPRSEETQAASDASSSGDCPF